MTHRLLPAEHSAIHFRKGTQGANGAHVLDLLVASQVPTR